jgi:hypothetical protein
VYRQTPIFTNFWKNYKQPEVFWLDTQETGRSVIARCRMWTIQKLKSYWGMFGFPRDRITLYICVLMPFCLLKITELSKPWMLYRKLWKARSKQKQANINNSMEHSPSWEAKLSLSYSRNSPFFYGTGICIIVFTRYCHWALTWARYIVHSLACSVYFM